MQSEGDTDPVVHRPGCSLPVGDLSYFMITKEVTIFQPAALLIARGMAMYKPGHDDAGIENKDQ